MKCERCGTIFCWDEADEGGGPRRYCSKTCQRKSAPGYKEGKSRTRGRAKDRKSAEREQHEQDVRTQARLSACAESGKRAYPDERAALGSAGKFEQLHGERIYPYECPCGAWHLTSQPPGAGEKAIAIKRALFRASS